MVERKYIEIINHIYRAIIRNYNHNICSCKLCISTVALRRLLLLVFYILGKMRHDLITSATLVTFSIMHKRDETFEKVLPLFRLVLC